MPRRDLSSCDDDELVRRALRSESAAYGELVRRHQAAAARVAAIVGGSTEAASDIVQDAFVAAHRSLASYRGTGSVRSWLLRVVANHARNERRSIDRRLRREDRHARLEVRSSDDVADAVTRRQERAAVADALARLPEPDREVLGCRFVTGLTEAETAEVLDIAVGTVKSRTSRALERLRRAMVESGGEPGD